MVVKRRPKDEEVRQVPAEDDAAFQAYVHKGGSAARSQPDARKEVRFTLTVPGPMCQELDRIRESRPLKTSRHQWVLEAILEKMQRESGQGG
jgi:hypothetical protein